MKKILLVMSAVAMAVPVAAQTLYTQAIPDVVSEVRVSGTTRLTVVATEGTFRLQTTSPRQAAAVKGDRMTLSSSSAADLTLLLPAGRSVTFVAEDYASLVVDGSLGKRPSLTVHTKDYARALFSGALADSVWAVMISLQAEDYSQIHSEVRLMQYGFEVLPKDYAHITVDCFQERPEPGMGSRTQKVRQCDNCFVDWNYCYEDSVINVRGDGEEAQEVHDRMQRYKITHDGRQAAASENLIRTNGGGEKRRSFWCWRDVALNFAWGFHNWGTGMWNGLSGVEGDAAVRTSFNHLHLSVDIPIVGTRHLGLYAGVGLDWDNYKFEAPEVSFDAATGRFVDGGDPECSSRLLTRYAVLPVTLRVDIGDRWQLTLAALPGIHWSGSHTGLRRDYEGATSDVFQKDQSVNRHINPYKLDLRVALTYEGFGLYFQLPTRSTMRSSAQDLYPVKLGLFVTLDM